RANHVGRGLDVVMHDEVDRDRDLEIVRGTKTIAARKAFLEMGPVELVVVVWRVEQRQPSVRDLRGLRDVLGTLRAEEDRDPFSQRMKCGLERLAKSGDAVAARNWQRVVGAIGGD